MIREALAARSAAVTALGSAIAAELARGDLFAGDSFEAVTARGMAANGAAEAALRGSLADPLPGPALVSARLRAIADALDGIATLRPALPDPALAGAIAEGERFAAAAVQSKALRAAAGEIACPLCFRAMAGDLVVCWSCFKATGRLEKYVSPSEVTRWEAARCERGFHSHDGPCVGVRGAKPQDNAEGRDDG